VIFRPTYIILREKKHISFSLGVHDADMKLFRSILQSTYCLYWHPELYLSDFHWGRGSELRLAMTDRATIAGMEVAKLVPWNS